MVDGLREALAMGQRQVQGLDKSVEALKKQLDELIAAKRSDEAELLDKFQKLLNEKKRKVRDFPEHSIPLWTLFLTS